MNRYAKNRQGFTLIELLIAVVIIGILAAIAIPSFAAVKVKTFDGAAKADLRNMITAQENYFTDTQAYKDIAVAAGARGDLNGDGVEDFRASRAVSVQATAYTDGFQITAKHANSPNTWCVNSSATQATIGAGSILNSSSC